MPDSKEQTELAIVQDAPLVLAQTDPMEIIAQVALDPACDVEKLERLMGLQERYKANQAAEAFGEALTMFQARCPIVKKTKVASVKMRTGGTYTYNFASLDDVIRQIRPALAAAGLSVSFTSAPAEKNCILIKTTIRHGTHTETSDFTCPVPDMTVNETQKMGAALSYAKRYALCAALNIAVSDDDDDAGNLGPADTMDLPAQKASLLANVTEWRKDCESSLDDVGFLIAVAESELNKKRLTTIGEVEHLRKVIIVDKAYDPATAEKFPTDK